MRKNRFRFRAWNKVDKTMYTGLPYSGSGKTGSDTFDVVLKHPQIYEVMQCADVYDNDGVLVFEGDYLSDGMTLWEVKYSAAHTGLYAISVAGPRMGTSNVTFSLWHLCNHHNAGRSVRVAGNIYEYKGPLKNLIN